MSGMLILLGILLIIMGIIIYPDIRYKSIIIQEDYEGKIIIKTDRKGNEHTKIVPKSYKNINRKNN